MENEDKKEKHKIEHKKESHEETKHSKQITLTDKLRENPWILSTLVLGVISLILIIATFGGVGTGSVSKDEAGKIVLDLAKAQISDAELVKVGENSGLYEVTLLLNQREVPVFLTSDGKNLVGGLTPISSINPQDKNTDTNKPTEIPKTDKPKAELFIMTHCPYGTQAEKGLIPVIKALGSSADIKIRFVHYFMHGDKEEAETYNQVCIREEQATKYIDYLSCFLEDSDSTRCLDKTKIDKTKLNTCLKDKAKTYYEADKILSNSYGVQGSPTLIINGAQSSAGRSSSSY
ncbi:MAG: hypothetical protein AABW81_03055, partial [Nanoarchaeota archaeon]